MCTSSLEMPLFCYTTIVLYDLFHGGSAGGPQGDFPTLLAIFFPLCRVSYLVPYTATPSRDTPSECFHPATLALSLSVLPEVIEVLSKVVDEDLLSASLTSSLMVRGVPEQRSIVLSLSSPLPPHGREESFDGVAYVHRVYQVFTLPPDGEGRFPIYSECPHELRVDFSLRIIGAEKNSI